MALPATFDRASVHGKYVNLDGSIPTGTVTFVGGILLRAVGVDTVILPSQFTVTLSGAGEFTVLLPTTDDPDITPFDWQYEVTERFNTFTRTYYMEVPYDTVGTIEIADLEVPLGGNMAVERGRYVESIAGRVGTVTLAQLATGTASATTFLRGDGTWAVPAGSGGGVTAHSALTGLSTGDDHPQYLNNTRGDARYLLIGARGAVNGVASLDAAGRVPLTQLADGTASTTVFLRGDGTWATPAGSTGVSAHNQLTGLTTGDDHPQYHNDSRGDARYVRTSARGTANGVASLDGTARVPVAQLGAGTATATVFLRGDGTWAAPSTIVGDHTHTSSQVTDFTEAVQDATAGLLVAGTGVGLVYNDTANTLTISATGGGGGATDPEVVRDTIGAALLGAAPITVAADDASDTITISTTATANSSDTFLRDRANHTGTQLSATISDLADSVLTTAGRNRVSNTSGENGVATWDAVGATVESVTDAAGETSLLLTITRATAASWLVGGGGVTVGPTLNTMPVTGGTVVRVGAKVRPPTTATYRINLEEFDRDGTRLTPTQSTAYLSSAGGVWTSHSGTFTLKAATTNIRVTVITQAFGPVDSTFNVKDVFVLGGGPVVTWDQIVNRPSTGVQTVNGKSGQSITLGLPDLGDVYAPQAVFDDQGNLVSPGPSHLDVAQYDAETSRYVVGPLNPAGHHHDDRYAPVGWVPPYTLRGVMLTDVTDPVPTDLPDNALLVYENYLGGLASLIPDDTGWKGWTYDPANGTSSTALDTGRMRGSLVPVRRAMTISKAGVVVVTAAVGTITSSGFALYDAATGALLGQANTALTDEDGAATTFTSTGVKVATFATPITVAAGQHVHVVCWINGTLSTLPDLMRSAINGAGSNAHLGSGVVGAAASYRFFQTDASTATTGTAAATLPSRSFASAVWAAIA